MKPVGRFWSTSISTTTPSARSSRAISLPKESSPRRLAQVASMPSRRSPMATLLSDPPKPILAVGACSKSPYPLLEARPIDSPKVNTLTAPVMWHALLGPLPAHG
jgi:hypothetical protein